MKRKIMRLAVTGALLALMAGTLTGCGKKEIDVMAGVELEFSGVDGSGTARITDEYAWEEEALEAAGLMEKMDSDDDAIETFQGVYKIEGAVEYEISQTDNLSNGDVVTVTASVNNEAVEDYKIQFTGTEKKFTVEGLKEIEEIDLFDGVSLEFSGISPYVKANVRNENTTNVVSVSFSLDKRENLAAGDTVTLTAEYNEENLLQKGYKAKENTKEFVVDECDRYVTMLEEIPEDLIGKMNKQFEDAFRARVAKEWKDADSLNSIEYIGNYLLTAKEGSDKRDKNIYYGIYKINAGDEENNLDYYSYCQFKNIIILKDGTCSVDLSDYKIPEGSVFSKKIYSGEIFWVDSIYYEGYKDLDSLFNNCITQNIDNYEYEANLTE